MKQAAEQKEKAGSRVRSFSSSFAERVHAVVAAIPKGETLSYGEVARRAGAPGAARAVGTLMSKNTNPAIPCHRVIRADGYAGGYNGGEREKEARLRSEGAAFKPAYGKDK